MNNQQITIIEPGRHSDFKIGDRPYVVKRAGDGKRKERQDGLWCRMKYGSKYGSVQLVQWHQISKQDQIKYQKL